MIGIQILHGVGVVLGMTATQVAIDRLAPRELRASAQALLTTFGGGLGSLIGQVGSGAALAAFALENGGHAWRAIFAIPFAVALAAALLLTLGFRERPAAPSVTAAP